MKPSPPMARAASIPALDGIRGVAILLVLLWHCADVTQFPFSSLGLLRPLVQAGWAGVDLFFALSGLLITKLILNEEAESPSGRLSLRDFYVRRALRIFPAFFLAVALVVFVLPATGAFPSTAPTGGSASPLALFSVASYWSNYYYGLSHVTPPKAVGIFWSLCVEEHFYVVWPVFLYLVRSARIRLGAAFAVCAVLPFVRWWSTPTLGLGVVHILSHTRIDSILWGALGALLLDAGVINRALRRLLLLGAAAGTAAASVAGQLSERPSAVGHAFVLSLLAIAGTAVSLEVTAAPSGAFARALSFSPLRAIGRVSYGMYLLHFAALDIAARQVVALYRFATPGAFLALMTTATLYTFAIAFVSFHFYERRFLALKSRFTPPRRASLAGLAPPVPPNAARLADGHPSPVPASEGGSKIPR